MRYTAKAKEVLTKFAASPRMTSKGMLVPTKKSVKSQVAKLTKQVKVLAKTSVEPLTTVSVVAANQNLLAQYDAFNLSRLSPNSSYAIPIFGKNATEISEVNKAYLQYKEVFVSIRQAAEPNLVRMTMFLVSLKDQGATTTVFDPASRQLVLTGGSDFGGTSTISEQIILNPKIFKTHAVRRFTMGAEGSAGPTADTYSQKRWRFIVKPTQKLIENPVGNVFNTSTFPSPTDPSQNYFLIVFNDNSGLDLESPKVDIQVYDHWTLPN